MGHDDNKIENFVIYPINLDGSIGEPVQLEKLKTVELELGVDSPDNLMYKDSIKFLSGTISGTLKCNLPRKMSRKKFKKWLMSNGFKRDLAELFCQIIASFEGRISYQSIYVDSFLVPTPHTLHHSITLEIHKQYEGERTHG